MQGKPDIINKNDFCIFRGMLFKKKYRLRRVKPIWRNSARRKNVKVDKSSLEDSIEQLARGGIIAKAGRRAIEEQLKNGLSVTIKMGNNIYYIYPDGRTEIILHQPIQLVNISQDILQIPE